MLDDVVGRDRKIVLGGTQRMSRACSALAGDEQALAQAERERVAAALRIE